MNISSPPAAPEVPFKNEERHKTPGITSALHSLVLATTLMHQQLFGHERQKPVELPRFAVGMNVLWSDGSKGEIVQKARWIEDEERNDGGWFYTVVFHPHDPDALHWLLPEEGLAEDRDASSVIK